jgi:hypothetical protein
VTITIDSNENQLDSNIEQSSRKTMATTNTAALASHGAQSEDIIRHIIRDIVYHSSNILKQRKTETSNLTSNLQNINLNDSKANTGLPPLPAKVTQSQSRSGSGGAAPSPASGKGLAIKAVDDETDQAQNQNQHQHVTAASTDSSSGIGPNPPPPHTPLPELQHLFAAGIKSHVGPHAVSDTLAAFVVRAVVLDPRNDFRIERELTKEEVERLISVSVDIFT